MNKFVSIFVSIMLVLCLASSTAFGIVNFVKNKNLDAKITAADAKITGAEAKIDKISAYTDGEDVAQEDDVLIAGEYEIKSTKQISDAYISGDSSSLSDRDKETLGMAEEVIKKYITDDMTDYDKEYAIYKYLTTEMTEDNGLLTVVPTSSESSGDPYGVLKYKTAVCVGYATTMRMFMQMFGIDCKVVHSTDLTHSWDLVNLDGDWYHVDCYMDSGSGSTRYFNNTDSMMVDSHSWNTDFFPAADSVKYTPAVMNSEEIDNIYSFPEWFSGKYENIKNGDAFSCTFKEKITDENTAAAQYIISTILDGLNSQIDGYLEYVWALNENDEYVLCIFYSSYDDISYNVDLTDEQKEKADDAISEYFDYLLNEDYYEDYYEYYDDYDYEY